MYIYIKELKKDEELAQNIDMPIFLKKIIIKFIKKFNIITLKKIDEKHTLYIIPKVKKIKTIQKIINKKPKEKIILSKELKKYEKDLGLPKEKKPIIYYIYEILKYSIEKAGKKVELQNIHILADNYNKQNIEIITYLLDKVKTLNIVTNSTQKYNILENKIYNEQGILITVANNKNKSLKRANIIINLDFKSEKLQEYTINRNAILINCTNEKVEIKYFQGIIINDINIKIENKPNHEELCNEFNEEDIYTSFETISSKYIENIQKIEENKIKIINIIGNNGIINTKELLNIQKELDKLQKLN